MSDITRQDLLNLFPEDKDAIGQISDQELANINKFLQEEQSDLSGGQEEQSDISLSLIGGHIRVEPDHTLKTSNQTNYGSGDPVPQKGRGVRLTKIDRFKTGDEYSLTYAGKTIILGVGGKSYLYISGKSLPSSSAMGTFE